MEKDKSLGTTILGEVRGEDSFSHITDEDQYTKLNKLESLKLYLIMVIDAMDKLRQSELDKDSISVGMSDAIDQLTERAINKIEEASMLFNKAMNKIK